jgi:hypothetical protein
MSTRRIPVATLVAGGLLAAGVAAAGALTASGALAAGSSPAPSAAPSAPTAPGTPGQGPRGFAGRGRGGFGGPETALGGRLLHGDVVVAKPGGGTETLLVQEGTISAKSTGSITVKSSDGFTTVWTLDKNTRIRAGWKNGSVTDLAVGQTVSVSGTKSGSGGTAQFVGERPEGAPNANGPGTRRFGGGGPGVRPSSPAPSSSAGGAGYGTA